MTEQQMWDLEEKLESLGIEQPGWIGEDLSPYDIIAIYKGGCASGAYMPAVTYHQALGTMNKYGDEVFEYIINDLGELPSPMENTTWSDLACFYLSTAVELFASNAYAQLEDIDLLEEEEEEEE